MFSVDNAVKLLVGECKELFKYERAIHLFQFHVWTLSPAARTYVSWAGQMAAVIFLDHLEEEDFYASPEAIRRFGAKSKPRQTMEEIDRMWQHNRIYRDIYDWMIALHGGGLMGLLGTPSPGDFDLAMAKRQANAEAAVDVIDYRLRYIQHGPGDERGSSPKHAFHFMWAATKNIPGRRGKTVQGKSPSARTLARKWHQYERSAIFIYLNKRYGFSQHPIPIDDVEFVPELLKQSENINELRRYFGAYAYIAESFEAADGERPFVTVPGTIDRVPVSTAPFSDVELKIIGDYKEDKPIIDTRLEPDDLDI